jgi:uncharacterized protein (DUF697 family)
MFDTIKEFINPSKNPDLSQAHKFQKNNLPTLWLLGKTGAGKSSLIEALTGLTSVEVGNGFSPCTLTSKAYDFPTDKPILRFLDTRGLAEAGYDPAEDIKACSKQGHALIVVAKTEEPEQSAILTALKSIKKDKAIKHILVVHTAVKQVNEKDRLRLLQHNQQQVEDAWGTDIPYVDVDFELDNGSIYNKKLLEQKLADILPIISCMFNDNEHASSEEQNFNTLRTEVLWYSSTASVSDLVPGVGLVSVPAIQAKLLHSLANQYGVEWNKRTFSELIGTLGTSFGVQYGLKLGIRQLVKFIPVYGQTVGAATAAAMSFATTYALGRVACKYFYHKSKGENVSDEEMQYLYKSAFSKGKEVADVE